MHMPVTLVSRAKPAQRSPGCEAQSFWLSKSGVARNRDGEPGRARRRQRVRNLPNSKVTHMRKATYMCKVTHV